MGCSRGDKGLGCRNNAHPMEYDSVCRVGIEGLERIQFGKV